MNKYIELLVPDVGGDSLEVTDLIVSKGDSVKEGQLLVTVETDKASMEIPSLIEGVILEVNIKVGDLLREGDCFALVCVPEHSFNSAYFSIDSLNILNKEPNQMIIEIKVPELPEAASDATVARWHVTEGEVVSKDQNLVDIETDKVVLDVTAQEGGIITKIIHAEGDTVVSQQIVGILVHKSECNAGVEALLKRFESVVKTT